MVGRNFFTQIKEESRERILSRNEMGLLVANAQAPSKHMILVALNTGMRKAEIYNLEWVNVNLEHNFITITAQEARNKKIMRIPINRWVGTPYTLKTPKPGEIISYSFLLSRMSFHAWFFGSFTHLHAPSPQFAFSPAARGAIKSEL